MNPHVCAKRATAFTLIELLVVISIIALLVGILLSGFFGQGWLFALAGAALGFAVHFPLWVLQVEKGGDAKLMIAAGAFLGWQGLLELTLATMILYLPMGLAILIARGRLQNFGKHLRHLVNQTMNVPTVQPEEVTVTVMGPLILVAGLVTLATTWFDLVAVMG